MTISKRKPQSIDQWLGRRVRQRRRDLKLTQAALGARIGITFQQVQKYEAGTNRLAVSRLIDIADALQTPIGWFLGEVDTSLGRTLAGATLADVDFIKAFMALPEPARNQLSRALMGDSA
ncbi:MAG: helix-turn-helix domain-containing protein [Pseudomonadota bacterium]